MRKMISVFLNPSNGTFEKEELEDGNLANQIMFRLAKDDSGKYVDSIGFYCGVGYEEKMLIKLKKTEISDRKKEIKRLTKEISNIEKFILL